MKQEFMKSKVEPVIGWLLLAVLLFASTQMKFYKAYEVYGTYVFRFCCSFCGTDVF